MEFGIRIGSLGNVRTTTLKAFTEEEIARVVNEWVSMLTYFKLRDLNFILSLALLFSLTSLLSRRYDIACYHTEM